jgi:4-diphosphocytidyl-2-C-methyl-D-erythritol kinase
VPTTITLQPNAKVNLGLHITGRREDGYHLLQTALVPVPELHDTLSITAASELTQPELSVVGVTLSGDPNDNLVIRAWRLLKEWSPTLPAVGVLLEKRIPAGAGLGGGSSDAAAMLRGLVELFELDISHDQLATLALTLGADVPFFLINEPRYATGIGEVLSPLDVDLKGYQIELITPAIHSDTREAYRNLKPEHWSGNRQLNALLKQPVATWRDTVRNDFEPSVFKRYPVLAELKESLYQRGAVYASMSGSGSAIYGLFERDV